MFTRWQRFRLPRTTETRSCSLLWSRKVARSSGKVKMQKYSDLRAGFRQQANPIGLRERPRPPKDKKKIRKKKWIRSKPRNSPGDTKTILETGGVTPQELFRSGEEFSTHNPKPKLIRAKEVSDQKLALLKIIQLFYCIFLSFSRRWDSSFEVLSR